jgi:hypothetical protein
MTRQRNHALCIVHDPFLFDSHPPLADVASNAGALGFWRSRAGWRRRRRYSSSRGGRWVGLFIPYMAAPLVDCF